MLCRKVVEHWCHVVVVKNRLGKHSSGMTGLIDAALLQRMEDSPHQVSSHLLLCDIDQSSGRL